MGLTGSDVALMESRFGVARYGATRFGYQSNIPIVSVDGTDVSAYVEWSTVVWTERINNEPDRVDLRLRSGAGEPTEGEELVLSLGAADNEVFAGPIVRVRKRNPTPDGAAEGLVYEVEAIDHSRLLDRRRVVGRYTGNANTIVSSLISDFASGFTTNNVDAGAPNIDEISFKYETLTGALSRVADRVGWTWFVDPSRDLHFFDPTSTTPTKANALREPVSIQFRDSLEIEKSGAQVRTRVIVEGGGSTTTAAITAGDTSVAVASADVFDDLLTDGYDGIAALGVDEITYTGVTFDAGSTGPGTLTGVPASGAGSIANNYELGAECNIIVKRNDSTEQTARASVEGGDGIHEIYVRDRRLSPDGCADRGDAELANWAGTITQGQYETRDRLARAGNTVEIDLPTGWNEGGATSYLIQWQRTRWVSRQVFRRQVRFAPIERTFTQLLKDTKLLSLEGDA